MTRLCSTRSARRREGSGWSDVGCGFRSKHRALEQLYCRLVVHFVEHAIHSAGNYTHNETSFANAILGGGAPSSRRVADLALVCGRCWSHSKGSARHGVRWLSQVRYARPGRATGRRCDRGSAARRRAPARSSSSSSTLAQVAGQRLDYVHPVERERHARMRRLVRDEQLRSGLGGTFEQAESWLWLVHAEIGAGWRSRCACAAPNALPC